ncbi:hypothetical protein RI367_005274 [Sorochytrium milnesiophthora]
MDYLSPGEESNSGSSEPSRSRSCTVTSSDDTTNAGSPPSAHGVVEQHEQQPEDDVMMDYRDGSSSLRVLQEPRWIVPTARTVAPVLGGASHYLLPPPLPTVQSDDDQAAFNLMPPLVIGVQGEDIERSSSGSTAELDVDAIALGGSTSSSLTQLSEPVPQELLGPVSPSHDGSDSHPPVINHVAVFPHLVMTGASLATLEDLLIVKARLSIAMHDLSRLPQGILTSDSEFSDLPPGSPPTRPTSVSPVPLDDDEDAAHARRSSSPASLFTGSPPLATLQVPTDMDGVSDGTSSTGHDAIDSLTCTLLLRFISHTSSPDEEMPPDASTLPTVRHPRADTRLCAWLKAHGYTETTSQADCINLLHVHRSLALADQYPTTGSSGDGSSDVDNVVH